MILALARLRQYGVNRLVVGDNLGVAPRADPTTSLYSTCLSRNRIFRRDAPAEPMPGG